MSERASSEKSRASRSMSKSRNGELHRSRSKSASPIRGRSESRSRSRSYRKKKYRSRTRSPSYSRQKSRHSRTRSRSRSLRRRSRSYSGGGNRSRSAGHPRPNRCLGVFGLCIYTTERQIRDIFQKYGSLDKVQIIFDAKTGRSRGFCFVYFESEEDAQRAKEECSGMDIDGRRIRVDFSITQRAHTPTPGIYMGSPTFTRNDRHYDRRRSNYDDDYRGGRSSYRKRSPSPYRRSYRRRYDHSRSRSYSPRR